METTSIAMKGIDDFDVAGRTVLLRPDINSPIDGTTRRIVNTNRLEKAAPTLKALLERGARVAIIAHQGDTLDYRNLIPLTEHAAILSTLTGHRITYIDDVCGPAAREAIENLKIGEGVLLGNLRYLTEEVTAFEKEVKLEPGQMLDTWLVRSLAPLVDLYVNDAFAAAHRNAPSMVAFQQILPTAGGRQLIAEYTALSKVASHPARPCVFVLGGGKISDAFGMMRNVLAAHTADRILTTGVTGMVMLLAQDVVLGEATERFLQDRDLLVFVDEARKLLAEWKDRFLCPVDLAYEDAGKRRETPVEAIAGDKDLENGLFQDIGGRTIDTYRAVIATAGTVFVNGPAGVYEDDRWALGTKHLWDAIARAPGFTVIGGGDTVTAAAKFTGLDPFSYVCTAGGAMVRFLSGRKLPLVAAMEEAYRKNLPLREK